MRQPEFQHLSDPEIEFLHHSTRIGALTRLDLPQSISVGLDSMGPARDPKTDSLFPGMKETLYRFRDTMRRYGLTLVVATNGPDIEGVDILEAIDPDHSAVVRAFAVTEGGARLLNRSRDGLGWDFTTLADEREIEALDRVTEEVSRRSKLIKVMLEDKNPNGSDASIRTPYHANVVLTLPNSFDTLKTRFIENDIRVESVMLGINSHNYLDKMLGFTEQEIRAVITDLGLRQSVSQLTKRQNRRHYVTPAHLFDGSGLDKMGGIVLGTGILSRELERWGAPKYSGYNIGNSVYIADKVVDITGEGQTVIGSSEQSMIRNFTYFVGDIPQGVRIAKKYQIIPGADGKDIHLVDIYTRLAINVTMDEALPKITEIEGAKILHVGSGAKALEALEYLYDRIHG